MVFALLWLISLRTMPSGSMHVPSLLWLNHIPRCVCVCACMLLYLFIHQCTGKLFPCLFCCEYCYNNNPINFEFLPWFDKFLRKHCKYICAEFQKCGSWRVTWISLCKVVHASPFAQKPILIFLFFKIQFKCHLSQKPTLISTPFYWKGVINFASIFHCDNLHTSQFLYVYSTFL